MKDKNILQLSAWAKSREIEFACKCAIHEKNSSFCGHWKGRVENQKGMILMEINIGRWKLDTIKMLKIILKTKEPWLKCFHPLFPQIFFEGRTLTHHWPEKLPPTEMAAEPKARLCFQFSTAPNSILQPSYFFQMLNIICWGVTICSSYCTYAFAMWHLTPIGQHILMHNGFFRISTSFLEIRNWGVHGVHLMFFL